MAARQDDAENQSSPRDYKWIIGVVIGLIGLVFGYVQWMEARSTTAEVEELRSMLTDREDLIQRIRDHVPGLVTRLEEQAGVASDASFIYSGMVGSGEDIETSAFESNLEAEAQALIDLAQFARRTQQELTAISDGIIDSMEQALNEGDLESVASAIDRYWSLFGAKKDEIREAIRRLCLYDDSLVAELEAATTG